MSEPTSIKIDPIERVRDKYGDDMAYRVKEMKEMFSQVKPKENSVVIDMRPIFVTIVTAALVWGKEPRFINGADIQTTVMDLVNRFFTDK